MAQHSATCCYLWSVILLVLSAGLASAQDEAVCYGPGSMAAGVILSILFTAVLLAGLYYWWKKYRTRPDHLILETDPETGKAEFAFDNPGFKDAGFTPMARPIEKNAKHETGKTKWNQWSPLAALTMKNEKRKTLDDSAIEGNEVKVIALRSHDFTGLGFNICGNMKEGIYIKDVLHRGPASESGKLNSGDRINSVTISFEHMVYEDALTILSYASPYEVIIEAKSGKLISNTSGQGGQPGHPIYRSSSCTDLYSGEKSAKKRLFGDEFNGSLSSTCSSLQKSRSNMTTLERKESKSPKVNQMLAKKPKSHLSPDQLKMQLEQKIMSDHQQNLRIKNEKPMRIESETQKQENKFQKFGIRVLPTEQQKSPKTAELSQNENNINIERHQVEPRSIDEVDNKKNSAPQAKKREKKASPEKPDEFVRQNSLNGSGIKRDKNGIPQEIPSHMLNAAMAAQKNRKNSEDRTLHVEEEIDVGKTPRKKSKAPPPPEERRTEKSPSKESLDEIQTLPDTLVEQKTSRSASKNGKTPSENDENEVELRSKEIKDYNSDSDLETDNQSSVNTIELNSSDITIHHSDEGEDRQNRRTASTGDLTKMQRHRKTSTGTLERAQSLDITDTGIPSLAKKRKAGRIDDSFDINQSDEDIFGKVMLDKEPRLSLILDGLNTFQRNRLKKSTEWGNLEDAVHKLNQEDETKSFDSNVTIEDLRIDFPDRSPELTALVDKIKEIKRESLELERDGEEEINNLQKTEKQVKNQIWPSEDEISEVIEVVSKRQIIRTEHDCIPFPKELEEKLPKEEQSGEDIQLRVHSELPKANFVLHQEETAIEKPRVSHKTEHSKDKPAIPEKRGRYAEEQPISYIELDAKQVSEKVEMEEKRQPSSITIITSGGEKIDTGNNSYVASSPVTSSSNDTNKSVTPTASKEPVNLVPSSCSNKTDENKTNVTSATPLMPDTLDLTERFLNNEKYLCEQDIYNPIKGDTNISDDIKVSRHSLGSLERPKSYSNVSVSSSPSSLKNISNVTVNNVNNTENGNSGLPSLEVNVNETNTRTNDTTAADVSELYTTALESSVRENKTDMSKIMISTPDLIKNVSITEAINSLNNDITLQGPSSLSLGPSDKVGITENRFSTITNNVRKFDVPESKKLKDTPADNANKSSSTLTYITEIQVTPNTKNISEIEIIPNSQLPEKNGRNLDNEFENYVKNFESNVKSFETNIKDFEKNLGGAPNQDVDNVMITDNIDVEKELHKIQEIAEEQLKKLPEMRFTTSSYEPSRIPEKRQSQIELLRSNFEKSPPKSSKTEVTTKSRIPIATTAKTPPMSPERRDSRNFDMEQDKALLDLMSSSIHSTPHPPKYQSKSPSKNVTVTSIRTSSKIPSGLPTLSSGRPPIPPRKYDNNENDSIIQVSTNGGTESSFKQWVFNPNDSVTNIVVTQNKHDQK